MKKIKNFNLTKKLSALILAVALVASTAIALGFGFKSVSASAATANVERSGLGLSVDAVKTDYLDLTELKDGSPIFDTAWLTSQVNNANYVSVGSTKTETYMDAFFENIEKQFTANLNFNQSASLNLDLFVTALSNAFHVRNVSGKKFYASQLYYLFQNKIERYTLSLPNYSSDLSAYKSHLNANFLNALQKLCDGQMDSETFFGTYGTHVILKGVYGGMLNMTYHFMSDKYDVGKVHSAEIGNAISAGIEGVVNATGSMNFNINSTLNCGVGDVKENFYLTARGGNPFSGTSVYSFSQNFKSWANSVVNSPVLIAPTSDGMVPIWEILPEQYSNLKSELKDDFIIYAELNKRIIDDGETYFGLYNVNFSQTFKSDKRPDEFLITDDTLPCSDYSDTFDLNDKAYGYDLLSSVGYRYVNVSIRLQMREEHRGYQHFFLYFGGKCMDQIKYEYGGTSLKKDYSYVTFAFKQIKFVELKEMGLNKYKPIEIKYGATGSQDDDWYNKDCIITVEISKN